MRRGPLTGRLLSRRWRVGELLGHGGMSTVYEATHRSGKRVAIKVLRFDLLGNERTRRRFMREGYIANRVGHPGVAAVLDDAVSEDGAAFLVMELLEGMNVEQYCAACGGTLPREEVLAIVDSVLDILAAAHTKRVVHRDVKPSNLFLTTKGTLKLLDFGIASFREVSGTINTTGEGVLLGTPGFMAPEQARGRWKDVDARTDLWAVGALMFRLLTGRLVYETENSNEYVIAAATEPAPSLASIDPSLPKGIVAIADRALMREPEARFQSASEMRAAIRAEMALFAHCAVPIVAKRSDGAMTLDESLSTAGLAGELPLPGEEETLVPLSTRSAKRILPWFAYGALGALALLVGISRRSDHAASAATPRAPRAQREPIDDREPIAPLAAVLPTASAGAVMANTSASSLAKPSLAHPGADANAPNDPSSSAVRGGTSRGLAAAPHAIAPPTAASSVPPAKSAPSAVQKTAPTRLEDVLDERR